MDENRFIFFPEAQFVDDPAAHGLHAEDVSFTAPDGPRLHGWFFDADQRSAVVVCCHGNTGNIGHRLAPVSRLLQIPAAVLMFDYRGFGRSEGTASESGLYADAQAAVAEARRRVGQVPLVLFGRGLGGSVAANVAARNAPIDGLVLESTFCSLADMVDKFFPFAPAGYRPRSRFDTLDALSRVQVPVLLVHGERDELVPFSHGQRLYGAAVGPKRFLALEGAGHRDTASVGGEEYWSAWRAFVGVVADRAARTP